MSIVPMLFSAFLVMSMCSVMVWDVRHYTIPNWLNLVILVVGLVAASVLPGVDLLNALIGLGIMFVAGIAIFAFRLMGGGDAKLLIALGVWFGYGMPLLDFVLASAIAGGVLALLLLSVRTIAPYVGMRIGAKTIPRVFTHKEPVPFGVAIGVAVIWLWADGRVPGLAGL